MSKASSVVASVTQQSRQRVPQSRTEYSRQLDTRHSTDAAATSRSYESRWLYLTCSCTSSQWWPCGSFNHNCLLCYFENTTNSDRCRSVPFFGSLCHLISVVAMYNGRLWSSMCKFIISLCNWWICRRLEQTPLLSNVLNALIIGWKDASCLERYITSASLLSVCHGLLPLTTTFMWCPHSDLVLLTYLF